MSRATLATVSPMPGTPTIGVVGAGQLARMMHQAAIGLGLPMTYLAQTAEDPAAAVSGRYSIGSAMMDTDLGAFAKACDVMTFDHEVVDIEGLADIERGGAVIRPPVKALSVVADKLGMRRAVEWSGLPVPPWRRVRSVGEAQDVFGEWGPLVLKPARGGYDGRGVFPVDDPADLTAIVPKLTARSPSLLAEPLLDIDREVAAFVVRGADGAIVVYDPVATIQVDGQCRQVVAPAPLPEQLADESRRMAVTAAESIGAVGVMAMELFVVEGRLVVNELAVRPHNSGHHSIDACVTSQFENHLRAVAGLPLGDPSLRTPHAVMVNLIGSGDPVEPGERLAGALAVDPEVRVHLYGKEPRPNRKIGHVTVNDSDPNRAADRAWAAIRALGGDVPEIGVS